MVRRLVLIGLMVLVEGMMQIIVGTSLAAMFLLFQVQAAPYTDTSDDLLASVASFCLVMFFICSYAFKDHELVGLDDIQARLSNEQRDTYVVNQRGLSLLMMGSVLGALLVSVMIFAVKVTVEGVRLRREALSSKARRLRYKSSHVEVSVPEVDHGHYHTFLSHVWGTGQDQMRIIKQRLLEMMPTLSVFLDVDDLDEIGDLEGYIRRTSTVLVYCSKGYFTSKNCMRELVASTVMEKPIIALMDPDASRGGMSAAELRMELFHADETCKKWGFTNPSAAAKAVSTSLPDMKGEVWPGAQALYDHLFASEPIEWNRIGHFQDCTMRLIAERLLCDAAGATYIDREIVSQKHNIKPLPLPPTGGFHVFCSPLNPGALQLVLEVGRERGFTVLLDSEASTRKAEAGILYVTTQLDQLASCSHMLLYLARQTWTRGDDASARLAEELSQAMDLKVVNLLLCHEMPGAGGQDSRGGCEFATFFSCPDGATPNTLLTRGIYSSIAIPLKGGPWRHISMVLMGRALGMSKAEAEQAIVKGEAGIFETSTALLQKASTEFSIRRLKQRTRRVLRGDNEMIRVKVAAESASSLNLAPCAAAAAASTYASATPSV